MKIIEIENIGKVKLVQSRNVKNICITLKPSKGIRVSYPNKTSLSTVLNFIREKELWIKNSIQKINQIELQTTIIDENSSFKTLFHTLKISKNTGNTAKATVKNGLIEIVHPESIPVTDKKVQELIRKAIFFTLNQEAKHYLPKRTQELAEKHKFAYNTVKISKATTRWGSCSGINRINYSISLMKLPEHLIDYVILHELCHTIHKNHGSKFWELLDKVSGNAKGFDKELKKYTTEKF